jgi:phage tail-like protein
VAEQFSFRLRITGPGGSQLFDLPAGTVYIGRQTGNDLVFADDKEVSRRHAVIECTLTQCHITDLESSNGSKVNGQEIAANVAITLSDGDIIQIGDHQLVLEQQVHESLSEPVASPALVPEIVSPSIIEPSAEPLALPDQAISAAGHNEAAEPMVIRTTLPQLPGLSLKSERLIKYLPAPFHEPFMSRFLGIFEAILMPMEWNVDNFDLFLSPGTAPLDFLPWLCSWFKVSFDSTWTEAQRRTFLKEAHTIYDRRGTKWALSRILEIYTGHQPEIIDLQDDLDPYTFVVRFPVARHALQLDLIEALINANKPAHTSYSLEFQ